MWQYSLAKLVVWLYGFLTHGKMYGKMTCGIVACASSMGQADLAGMVESLLTASLSWTILQGDVDAMCKDSVDLHATLSGSESEGSLLTLLLHL